MSDTTIPDTIDFKIVLQEAGPRSQFYNNYYISLVMRSVADLVGKNGTHFVSFTVLQNNPFRFEVKWQNCSLPRDCSSPEINTVNDMLFNTGDMKSLAIMKYFPSNITIMDIDSTCKNTPPVITSYPLNLTIPVCGKYSYRLPSNLSSDQEDGGSLIISMALFSGATLPRDSWIRFDSSTRTIRAMPTESVILIGQWKYLLFFTDSKGASANLTLNVKVENEANNYYRMVIRFKSLMATTTPYLDIQCKMLERVSEFTTNKVALDKYRIVSFSRDSSAGEMYVLIYADCTINKTICSSQESNLLNTESSLIVPGTTNAQASFVNFVRSMFQVQLIRREPAFLSVASFPRRLNYGILMIDKCESRLVDVRTFFADDLTLTYTIRFGDGGATLPLSYWTQMSSKTIYIYPGLDVAVGQYKFDLMATDSCGGRTTAPFVIDVRTVYGGGTPSAVFGYTWLIKVALQVDSRMPDVFYLNTIKSTMLSYVNTGTRQYSITIISYKRLGNGFEVRFGECSIGYFPCDQNKISELIRVLFPVGSGPSAQLRQRFQTENLTVSTFQGSRQETCGTPPGGPVCPEELSINTTFCSIIEFQLPANLCTDPDDGNLRQLALEFQDQSGGRVSTESWIQLNKTQQSIYGYPVYSEKMDIPTNLTYLLRVKDKTGKATYINVYVKIYGDRPTMDYKMSITASITTQQSRDYISERICIARRMSEFFGRDDINNIGYENTGINIVTFQWTFCKQKKLPCQCELIKTSQDRLRDDYTTLKSELATCSLSAQGTSYVLAGFCSKTNGPEVRDEIETTKTSVGQPYRRILPENMFADTEDGNIRNLTLVITDPNDQRLDGATWIQIDDGNKLCGLMAYKNYIQQGYQEVKNVKYKMVAIDSCGKRAESFFDMEIVNDFPGLKYRIVFLLDGKKAGYDCRKTDSLIQTVSDYAGVPSNDIFVDEFRDYKSNATNGTLFTWGVRSYVSKTCDGEEFETFREKFVKDGKGNEKLVERMESKDHKLLDVYDIVEEDCLPAFPWWILILVLLLMLLLLLLLLLWCCVPRCCETACLRACPCCGPCCTKGGRCASTADEKDEYIGIEPDDDEDGDDDGNLAKPIPPGDDETDGNGTRFGINNKEIYGDDLPDPRNEDILPPDYGMVGKDFVDYNPITGGGGPIGKDTSGGVIGRDALGGGGFQTESWTDDRRPLGVYGGQTADSRVYDRTVYGRNYDNRYRTSNIDRVERPSYIVSHSPNNRGSKSTAITSRQIVSKGNRVVRNRSGNNTGTTSDPGEFKYRIKRSDLSDYLARRGHSYQGDIYLTESDLNEIMHMRKVRRSKTSSHHRVQLRTDSRLADALVDRNYATRRRVNHRSNNNIERRYSTGSLLKTSTNGISEIRRTTNHARNLRSIDPRNVRLRFEDESLSEGRYTTSPDDNYYISDYTSNLGADGDRDTRYFYHRVGGGNEPNFSNRRFLMDDGAASTDTDDVIFEPVLETNRRRVLAPVSKRSHDEALYDEETPARRRRVFYRTEHNSNKDGGNGGGGGRTTAGEGRKPHMRSNNRRTVTTSFRNEAYNLDESSV